VPRTSPPPAALDRAPLPTTPAAGDRAVRPVIGTTDGRASSLTDAFDAVVPESDGEHGYDCCSYTQQTLSTVSSDGSEMLGTLLWDEMGTSTSGVGTTTRELYVSTGGTARFNHNRKSINPQTTCVFCTHKIQHSVIIMTESNASTI